MSLLPPFPIKGRSQCYVSLHIDEYVHIIMCHIYNTVKTLYRDQRRVVVIKSFYYVYVGKQTNHAK